MRCFSIVGCITACLLNLMSCYYQLLNELQSSWVVGLSLFLGHFSKTIT